MSTPSTTSGSTQNTLEELRDVLRDRKNSRVLEGRKLTEVKEGAYFPDEENPGTFAIDFLTAGGIETFRNAKREENKQPAPGGGSPGDEKVGPGEQPGLAIPATFEECWSQVCNSDLPPSDRVQALQECLLADNSRAVDLIVDELDRDDVPADWRDALVYAAENVHFKDPNQQARVRARLRELALELRETSRAGVEHVVWSALRRFSSLLPREEANDLLEFLDRKGVVDTRMVALQCVSRVFHAGPPSDPAAFEPLAGRVAEYGKKFLDPDVFAGGENSSIARNAVLALAALGSPRLEGCVDRVNALDRRWLSRQVRRQLQELLDTWKGHDSGSEGSPAFEIVESALKAVGPCEAG